MCACLLCRCFLYPATQQDLAVFTQDWHPPAHVSFASTYQADGADAFLVRPASARARARALPAPSAAGRGPLLAGPHP